MKKYINKILEKEKLYDLYLGNAKVTSIPKRLITNSPEKHLSNFCYLDLYYENLNNPDELSINLKNIPYLPSDTPIHISTPIHINFEKKTGQIKQILYRLEPLSLSCLKFSNGKIIEELYTTCKINQNRTRTVRNTFELSSFTIPYKVVYKENGSIDEEESYWMFDTDNKDPTVLTIKEYKEIIKDLNIDLCNFKIHKRHERILIHMYMNLKDFKQELEEIGIEATRESLLANCKVIEMYYL
jgi:hypothetical protein